jgi:hypothetical protein
MKVIQKVSMLISPSQLNSVWKVAGVLLFHMVSLHLTILCPAVHKVSDAIRKELFVLSVKAVIRCFLYLFIIICKLMTSKRPL